MGKSLYKMTTAERVAWEKETVTLVLNRRTAKKLSKYLYSLYNYGVPLHGDKRLYQKDEAVCEASHAFEKLTDGRRNSTTLDISEEV